MTDLMKPDINGDTPLMKLADTGQTQLLVGHLQNLGITSKELADYVNQVNNYGNTALMLAANHDHLSIVGVLLAAGADVHMVNQGGKSAAIMAGSQELTNVVDLLVQNGAERPPAVVQEDVPLTTTE